MDLRKPQKSGQAALEYMLILTVVAVVIFLAIRPAGSPSVLNRAQTRSEEYYNTVAQAIMGKNPQPVNGGWCSPKPNGVRECACPQPSFGGAPCIASDPTVIYCGDGICNGGETGEPGHPNTCFADCDYLPDCGNCGLITSSSACGEVCGGVTCSVGEVCMTSNCPRACAGFTQYCLASPSLCSGSCSCNPTTWIAAGGCGVASGTCTPTWLERCFTNANCNAACTAAQRIRAISDPTCGSCVATNYTISCGTGSVTIPATLRGSWGSANCPFGCTTQPMRAFCLNDGSGFGLPENICIPAVCLPMAYNSGACGFVNLPITSPGSSTPAVPCRTGCTGSITGTCPSGTATFTVSGTCVPDNCVERPYTTSYCGGVTIPATNHGTTTNVPCPGGCSGAGINATCNFGVFDSIIDNCLMNCPATSAAAGVCGTANLPAGTPSGSVGTAPCPGACTGTVSALCTNGTYGTPSNTCLLDCPALPVGAGSCGATSLPATTSGSVSSVACPSGCSGTLSATCTNGTFGPVTNGCGCPATDVGTSCGVATLPSVVNGSSSSAPCPGSCTGGTVSATCTSGTFGPVTDGCTCPATVVGSVCGSVTLPSTTSGNTSSAPCAGSCRGTVSATCNGSTFGAVTDACTTDCLPMTVAPPICGGTSVTLPGVPNNTMSLAPCPSPCVGAVVAVCQLGSFAGTIVNCIVECPETTVLFNEQYWTIPRTPHGQMINVGCPAVDCTGGVTLTCGDGGVWDISMRDCYCWAQP